MSIMEMEEIKNAIAGVESKVEYNGGGIDDLKANALLNAGSVVKSVQYGTFITESSTCKDIEIPISSVNPDKIFVLTQTVHNKTRWVLSGAILISKTNNSITLKAAGAVNSSENPMKCYHSWQVIEFY